MEIYKDISYTPQERAEDLLKRMTPEEKLAQLQCSLVIDTENLSELRELPDGVGEIMVQAAAATPEATADTNRKVIDYVIKNNRFGIPPILHLEALTGAVIPGAAIFPTAIGLGATFDPDTVENMADTISAQLRAAGFRQALSPVMDLGRDPRWGRIGETYGEDPALCAMMSTAYTRGLQGKDREKGVSATAKHFLGYSFGDGGLNMSSNPITERDIREEYAKPFQAAITEAGLMSVMNSYGSLDHELVIGSEKVLTGLLRDEMGFDGAVVSDYQSIDKLVTHRISGDMKDAGVQALKAGLDVECPMPVGYSDAILDAVRNGSLEEKNLDQAAKRVLTLKFRLGLFENPYPLPAEKIQQAFYDPEALERSLKAAEESIVLVKNDGILPLSENIRRIAVIGPHADSIRLLFGCYTLPAAVDMGISGALAEMPGMEAAAEKLDQEDGPEGKYFPGSTVLKEPETVGAALQAMYGNVTPTILAAIRKMAQGAEVTYVKGCDYAGTERNGFEDAIASAAEADVVIAAMGGKYGWGSGCTVGEGIDSADIQMTGVQEELALKLCETGKPVILLHMDARPLSSRKLKESCSAILECWYPGSTGGTAVAEVLFGKVNPAGRLPVTVAEHAGQIPIYSGQKTGNSYRAVRDKIIMCRYAEHSTEPLYPFGYGLSYTEFSYSGLQVTEEVSSGGTAEISVNVKNTGTKDGEEVVQLYIEDELAEMLRPVREFAGCARIRLAAGEEKKVTFRVRADQFAYLDREMRWYTEAGRMKVFVGASSDDIRLEGSFRITDSTYADGSRRGFYAYVSERSVH